MTTVVRSLLTRVSLIMYPIGQVTDADPQPHHADPDCNPVAADPISSMNVSMQLR
ncbi:hypothetical protein [Virgisporangium aurantiacum]|uniref:hypothetical protein n=1 Tax=Virgisporangium aurantiacum TaxID=175570 RepID=UPI00194FF884|nr:hypothetical protein [Virgisporangium aurantiacum]